MPRVLPRALLSLFFVAYFAVWVSGVFDVFPASDCPESLRFFTRSACLFPSAAVDAIDYYAEGWDCRQGRWVEIDHRPYFPTIVSGLDTRFELTTRLFRHNQQVLADLRAFLITRFNQDHPTQPITDVRLLSVRDPVPPPGGPIKRYQRLPLSQVPMKQRKLWSVFTDLPLRQQRCQSATAGQSFDPRDPDIPPPGKKRVRRPRPAQDGSNKTPVSAPAAPAETAGPTSAETPSAPAAESPGESQ